MTDTASKSCPACFKDIDSRALLSQRAGNANRFVSGDAAGYPEGDAPPIERVDAWHER